MDLDERGVAVHYALNYTTLYCTTILHYTTLHYSTLHFTSLHYTTFVDLDESDMAPVGLLTTLRVARCVLTWFTP